MVIDEGWGERGFAPSFAAGVVSPAAGKDSPVLARLARADGQQELRSITSVQLPEGCWPMSGRSRSAVRPMRPRERVLPVRGSGSVEVAAGPAAAPVWLPQAGKVPTSVSLTGPYKGAPYGLSIVVPA